MLLPSPVTAAFIAARADVAIDVDVNCVSCSAHAPREPAAESTTWRANYSVIRFGSARLGSCLHLGYQLSLRLRLRLAAILVCWWLVFLLLARQTSLLCLGRGWNWWCVCVLVVSVVMVVVVAHVRHVVVAAAFSSSLFSFTLTFESWETLCPQVSHKIFLARWCYKL